MKRLQLRRARWGLALYYWERPSRLWLVGVSWTWLWGLHATPFVRALALGPLVFARTDLLQP